MSVGVIPSAARPVASVFALRLPFSSQPVAVVAAAVARCVAQNATTRWRQPAGVGCVVGASRLLLTASLDQSVTLYSS